MVDRLHTLSVESNFGLLRLRTYRVLLLLDFKNMTILESPLDNIDLLACTLDVFGALECGPELAEVLELDEVPDVGKRSVDEHRLLDGGASWDNAGGSRHCGDSVWLMY